MMDISCPARYAGSLREATGLRCSRLIAASRVLCLVLVAAMWCMTAAAQTSHVPTTTRQGVTPQKKQCIEALFRIIPGAFNYCIAWNHWIEGEYRGGLEEMRSAAAWGNKDAQLFLGVAYFNGEHIPANRPLGLAWLGLAAERRETRAVQLLASAYAKSTPEERRKGQQLVDSMWPTYADAHAATRAEHRYQRELRRLVSSGGSVCLTGLSASPMVTTRDKSQSFIGIDHYMPGVAQASRPSRTIAIGASGCPPVAEVEQKLDGIYAETMRGWRGTTSVGPLHVVDGSRQKESAASEQ